MDEPHDQLNAAASIHLGVRPEEVLSRIEALVVDSLRGLAQGQLPCLEVVSLEGQKS